MSHGSTADFELLRYVVIPLTSALIGAGLAIFVPYLNERRARKQNELTSAITIKIKLNRMKENVSEASTAVALAEIMEDVSGKGKRTEFSYFNFFYSEKIIFSETDFKFILKYFGIDDVVNVSTINFSYNTMIDRFAIANSYHEDARKSPKYKNWKSLGSQEEYEKLLSADPLFFALQTSIEDLKGNFLVFEGLIEKNLAGIESKLDKFLSTHRGSIFSYNAIPF